MSFILSSVMLMGLFYMTFQSKPGKHGRDRAEKREEASALRVHGSMC